MWVPILIQISNIVLAQSETLLYMTTSRKHIRQEEKQCVLYKDVPTNTEHYKVKYSLHIIVMAGELIIPLLVTTAVQLMNGQQGNLKPEFQNKQYKPACTYYVSTTVYLSLGSNMITTNNTEVLITDIGEDAYASLTCHTDLTECCRNSDTGGQGGRGEWYYPDGRVVQNNAGSITVGDGFYRVRNAPQVLRLARRDASNALSPTGSYCCVIPTTRGEMTFCAKLS